jgi:catechol 2,3-dioxygenase-like lactoylglutathione lyase family enzyme
MQVNRLDHVNIHTADVERMVEWYGRVLGMPAGDRPPFSFPGAWLYSGGRPTVHLVGLDEQPKVTGLQLEHFAFSATGLKAFVERLQRQGVRYDARKVPSSGAVQINVWDPDGNHIHIDFSPEESAGVDVEETGLSVMRQPDQH